ncbi:MAG: alpha/beta fold hydrolase [Bacteroidetes bacterium]|nr:alpha/beta fold hydrolase [Bacteroidota bacterium]
MPVVKVGGRDVHYQELGSGIETAVLVHGMLGNLAVYYFHIAPMLAEHFHVVVYDLKSHGLSEKAEAGYDLESMSADLLGLMDVLGLRRVHLAGYSFGALIALKTAARFATRVDRLAIIEGPDPSDEEPLRVMMEYSKEAFDEWVGASGLSMGRRQLDRHHRMYEYIFQKTTMQADVQKQRDFFLGKEVASIPHRTLLLYGEDSDCATAGRLLERRMMDARLRLVKGDHNLPVQAPDVVADELMDFFK